MNLPYRKQSRLSNYDYSQTGCYHITVCSKDKRAIFCSITPGDAFSPSTPILTNFGFVVEKYILGINDIYSNISIDKYVIMPNHVHLLITLYDQEEKQTTKANKTIPFLISTLKRLSNKEAGIDLWQRGYFDHVIRNRQDYLSVWQYIDDNPTKWVYDDYYIR